MNYWPIENNVNDQVGGANMYNGNSASFTTDRFGSPNSAISLISGYYQVPAGVYFKGDLTISLWIKSRVLVDWAKIVDFGNKDADENVVISASRVDSGQPSPETYTGTNGRYITSTTALTIGAWTHLVFTLSGSTGALYMNGLLIGQGSDLFTPRNINRTLNYIGKDNWNSFLDGNGNLWADLDDLRFYNRAMSQAEINYLFLQQASTQASSLNR